MNTTMIFSDLRYERFEHALEIKQGFVSAHIFKRAKSYVSGKTGDV